MGYFFDIQVSMLCLQRDYPPAHPAILSWRAFAQDLCVRRSQQNGLSCASYTQQRSLHPILVYFPTTAGSAQFCLLCCQPEPVPRSSTARMSRFTPWDPCRLPAWLG